MQDQLGKAFRGIELNAYSPPLPVMSLVSRHISQHILAAQFRMYEVDVIVEFIEVVREKSSSTADIHDALKLAAARPQGADLSYGINLNIHFLGKFANFSGRVAAAVVFAVADNYQRFFSCAPLLIWSKPI